MLKHHFHNEIHQVCQGFFAVLFGQTLFPFTISKIAKPLEPVPLDGLISSCLREICEKWSDKQMTNQELNAQNYVFGVVGYSRWFFSLLLNLSCWFPVATTE